MAKKKKPATGARKHTQIENIEVFGAEARLSSLGLIVYADHYLYAAKTAQPSQNSGEFHPARLFLVCRSLELALKAFLSLRGDYSMSWLAALSATISISCWLKPTSKTSTLW